MSRINIWYAQLLVPVLSAILRRWSQPFKGEEARAARRSEPIHAAFFFAKRKKKSSEFVPCRGAGGVLVARVRMWPAFWLIVLVVESALGSCRAGRAVGTASTCAFLGCLCVQLFFFVLFVDRSLLAVDSFLPPVAEWHLTRSFGPTWLPGGDLAGKGSKVPKGVTRVCRSSWRSFVDSLAAPGGWPVAIAARQL